ncbi:lysine-sensitive aspartokinase 3 [Idiomarina sp. HP20-50]|uniref:lysine-sensitive aspartokinase 3 n=1 Tax=Idiomarina sp. HP20-50 TaxID=3070813 RepID=UPI00294A9F50|nr:lysine-sensitive aspartokinase 3 [Idiomarina sp. HP20-50]MDV6314971.1 lysine-sensitive aspartokinase 3 [Idiomarina sp. HP20-50]
MSFTVAKFGGTSVADYRSMLRCAEIIQNDSSIRLVVVSACAGVTNRLADIAIARDKKVDFLLDEIGAIHSSIVESFAFSEDKQRALSQLHEELGCHCGKPIEDWAAWRDELLSFGERCSSLLFSWVLEQNGIVSDTLDARQLLKTNSDFGRAQPDELTTKSHCLEQKQKLEPGCVWVTQGFIGSNNQGQTTTLGRGGSDYSAALIAAGFNATDLQIWTDVAGIYTTDPRICSSARAIAEMSFSEAAELATFGAKILHPSSLAPAIQNDIRVFIGSSKDALAGGTYVSASPTTRPDVRAVALRRNQTLVTVHSLSMLHASGFLARLFEILARYNVSVDLVTTSEVSIALTLDEGGSVANGEALLPAAALEELEQFSRVEIETGLSLVAIIGNGIGRDAHISQLTFNTVNNYAVRLICQGASEHNLCFLVDDAQGESVIRIVHEKILG